MASQVCLDPSVWTECPVCRVREGRRVKKDLAFKDFQDFVESLEKREELARWDCLAPRVKLDCRASPEWPDLGVRRD